MPCAVCGASPAAPVVFTSQQGMLILRHMKRREGTFCRSCGLAIGRHMQNDTLMAGWWGIISFFWNFVVITRNAVRLRAHALLPVPPPFAGQLSPGAPVWRRSGVAVAAAALVVAAVLIGLEVNNNANHNAALHAQPGQCVTLSSTDFASATANPRITGVVDCAAHHDGKVVTGNADGSCATGVVPFALTKNGVVQPNSTTCVDPSQ